MGVSLSKPKSREHEVKRAVMKVHGIPELSAMIYSSCTWFSLVALSHTCIETRKSVHGFLSVRIQSILSEYIERPLHEQFFTVLDETEGLIVGGLVRCVMSVETPACPRVGQMDVIVPKEVNGFAEFLCRDLGYQEVICENAGIVKGVCGVYRKFTKDQKVIMVYPGAKGSAIPTLLTMVVSSNLCALNSTTIACYYPKLFAQQQFFSLSMTSALPFDNSTYGLTSVDHSLDLCEVACPVVWRRTGLAATGILRWGGIDGSHSVSTRALRNEPFVSRRYMVRRDERYCGNRGCVNFGRAVDLEDWGHKLPTWGTSL